MDRYAGGKRTERRTKKRRGSGSSSAIGLSTGSSGGPGASGGGPRKWYKRPALWLGFAIALAAIVIAAGVFLAMRARGEDNTSADSSTDAVAQAGADTVTTAADVPLASSTDQMVASMKLEEKIGQMMMVGFQGTAPGADVTQNIQDRHIGSLIIYGRNIDSIEQVAGMDAELQKMADAAGQPAKLVIAIDQEGGSTRRFKDIGPYYSEPMIGEMPTEAAEAAAQQQASSAARDLKKIGINANLAPVLDVSDGGGSIMDVRSYGTTQETVTKLGIRAVRGYNNATTICSPKHFPGLGSADGDSEKTLPTVDLSAEAETGSELPPFKAAIDEGAPMILVAHVKVPSLDASGTPASLSKTIVTGLLRQNLGFKGVIITDDLEMGAITENMSVGDAAVAAVAAGNDMVMVAQTPANQAAVYDALLAAVKSGKLKEDDINKSVARIIDMKKKYRLEKSGSAATVN